MKVLVTGAAGFIGSNLVWRLLDADHEVHCLDKMTLMSDSRKELRELVASRFYRTHLHPKASKMLKWLEPTRLSDYCLSYKEYLSSPTLDKVLEHSIDILDEKEIAVHMREWQYDCVIHLAAIAGVRESFGDATNYVNTNILGFMNVLKWAAETEVTQFVFASSSSVYDSIGIEDIEEDYLASNDEYTSTMDRPMSIYAATKRADELLAHAYVKQYSQEHRQHNMLLTGLRFFTVYGPWGRPDMLIYKIANSLYKGDALWLNNEGKTRRDFTYVEDVCEAIARIIERTPRAYGSRMSRVWGNSHCEFLNIGASLPISVSEVISKMEEISERKAKTSEATKRTVQEPGLTLAKTDRLAGITNYRPDTSIGEGLRRFDKWYREYHNIRS